MSQRIIHERDSMYEFHVFDMNFMYEFYMYQSFRRIREDELHNSLQF